MPQITVVAVYQFDDQPSTLMHYCFSNWLLQPQSLSPLLVNGWPIEFLAVTHVW